MRSILILSLISVQVDCLNICGDWIQYKDTKCIKVVEAKVTKGEAEKECLSLKGTLFDVKSDDEQKFLESILTKYKNYSNAWIGLKYKASDKRFEWSNGSALDYNNWSEEAVKDGSGECVQMVIGERDFGKWTDESCLKKAMAVCQKSQVIDVSVLARTVESMEQTLEKVENNLIPIGFIYTQLPDQKRPRNIWPQFKWSDVTKDYAGLFFRAEGGNSAGFGEQQTDDSPQLIAVKTVYCDKFASCVDVDTNQMAIARGGWSKRILTGSFMKNGYGMSFETSSGEVRPVNKAVRIWKRIA